MLNKKENETRATARLSTFGICVIMKRPYTNFTFFLSERFGSATLTIEEENLLRASRSRTAREL